MTIVAELKRPLQDFVAISSDALQELIGLLIDLSSKGVIRKTDEGFYSIYDVIEKISDKGGHHKVWERLITGYPEVLTNIQYLQFSGQGQRLTPVADLATLIEIIWLLPNGLANKLCKPSTKTILTSLYVFIDEPREVCKIGISKNINGRLSEIQTGYPFPLSIYFTKPLSQPRKTESILHKALDDFRLKGEWFYTDCLIMIDFQKIN